MTWVNARVATSASSVSACRLSSGSAAAAMPKIVTKTIRGRRFPSTAACTGFAGISSTMKRAPPGICSAACCTNDESPRDPASSASR